MTDVPLRTFISIKIPAFETVKEIVDKLNKIENIRTSPFDQLHVTLLFLGDVKPASIPILCNRMRHTLSDTKEFDVILKDIGTFPRKGDPRVVWIGLEADPLNDIVSKISRELDTLDLGYDRKTFTPHMTIGRVNGKTDIHNIVEKNRDVEFGSFRCDHIDIMKSLVGRSGAKHTVIDSIILAK